MKILIDPAKYPIRPDHINAKRHFFGAFSNREKEISAGWIVEFCQKRNMGWQPFTAEEINAYYHAKGRPEEFRFNGLDANGYLPLQDDDKYYVTAEFVSRCFRASPAN
jgi:hypothetical protein